MALLVYTGGTFDLFHSGHVNFLYNCKKLAGMSGEVCVSLNTDEFIESYKGKPPVMSNEERFSVVGSCRYVDRVMWNTFGEDSRATIEDDYFEEAGCLPDAIVVGDDWAKKDYYAQMNFTQEWLDENDILLCYIPYTNGISSTIIKGRMV